ncbi:C-C motif chemokine 21 [Suncus etruscus]|uniref:C-C motif chemokine 21 n=1 Tax=Suncus etruscus TaxID=109475 RepID=UPI00210F6D80|nr:C-C motif chemokine 21 [Suncus etruscus]
MTPSQILSLIALLLACGFPKTQGNDGGAQDCCLKYSSKKIPSHVVRSYRKQEPSLGCPLPAILFAPKKRSLPEICADPKEDWVQKLMHILDQPPELRKPTKGCRKDKSGKKGKGSKGCKRNKQSETPKSP